MAGHGTCVDVSFKKFCLQAPIVGDRIGDTPVAFREMANIAVPVCGSKLCQLSQNDAFQETFRASLVDQLTLRVAKVAMPV